MEGPANPKPETQADNDEEPQVWSKSSTTAEDVKVQPSSSADARTFHTHVKIYMLSTGDDAGSECELRGWISFPGTQPTITNISIDLPVKTSYANENNGLGRLLAELSTDSAFQPAQFQAFLNEDDTAGVDWILSEVMDWTVATNVQYANGQEWTWRWFNTEDNRYQCILWWQVTPPL